MATKNTKIQAVYENMLQESSRLAHAYIKFESNSWGATDTLSYKFKAVQCLRDAESLAYNLNLTSSIFSQVGFLNAYDLPRSQYE